MQRQFQESHEPEPATRYLGGATAISASTHTFPPTTRIVWTRRVWREVALRVLGALTLPLLAGSLLFFLGLRDNGIPALQPGAGSLGELLTDRILSTMFFLGLAGAGYQAVTGRRVLRTALAGSLGALVAAPLAWLAFLALHLSGLWERLLAAVGGVGNNYPMHLLILLPAAGFLFAAWSSALGTPPRRAAQGGALFALVTYILYQLRDCFLSPELWHQWGSLLLIAGVVFVLPGALLGFLCALVARATSRRAGR